MPNINELTDDQFRLLLEEYFAEPKKPVKMKDDKVRDIVQRLNARIKVPVINETQEEKISEPI